MGVRTVTCLMFLLNVFIPIAYYIVWHEKDALSIPYWMKEPTWLEGRNSLQVSRSGILEFHSLELRVCVCVCVAQSCPTVCNSMDCSSPGSSVRGILQARILEWITVPFSRESSRPGIILRFLLHCRQILYHVSHLESPRGVFKPWCPSLIPMNDLTGFKCNLDRRVKKTNTLPGNSSEQWMLCRGNCILPATTLGLVSKNIYLCPRLLQLCTLPPPI